MIVLLAAVFSEFSCFLSNLVFVVIQKFKK